MNPRAGFPTYSLSRGAPSPLGYISKQVQFLVFVQFPRQKAVGGEGGIRTHGPCGSLVFKTSSLNHSDTSPYICPGCVRLISIIYYTTLPAVSQAVRRIFLCGAVMPGTPLPTPQAYAPARTDAFPAGKRSPFSSLHVSFPAFPDQLRKPVRASGTRSRGPRARTETGDQSLLFISSVPPV